ncbi:hypothetical protein GIB67_035526 [Kingdonia uniflora]|uniref:Rab-GAP TBC domain-containing protein n=1 Tax=Kingdonia uniflora TaxID=39325 RepID=A0A7J7MCJ1_9MAGN|nr:hypothetical protein GIB67_035526 [Kingdonia uniflora]
MSVDGIGEDNEKEKQWSCGKNGAVNLQRVGTMVRDIGDPCLHQSSPTKGSKMLKPDKWKASFDSDGKVFGFHKVLKLVILGGVDPSIRAEVWEFLLGCYALGSTTEYREQLRMARRMARRLEGKELVVRRTSPKERYKDLINQCQIMHSSIGTGTLAYVVGSKVMDVRTSSKDTLEREAENVQSRSRASRDSTNQVQTYSDWNNTTNHIDTSYESQRESFSDVGDLVSVRGSIDGAFYGSSPYNCFNQKAGRASHESQNVNGSYFDFPPLPVTDLFEKSDKESEGCRRKLSLTDENMHSFKINNNVDLIMESNGSPCNDILHASKSQSVSEQAVESKHFEQKPEINRLRMSDAPETAKIAATMPEGETASENRVSEWLWTLHRIVVDVVRTDSHLEFYEDTENVARMSDILAVFAWVDPATGYCQGGMSDLLSPFVILYEDNADAFWCFEMLLRRMRQNFQMEGPTGVMKQLRALWHILERTDREMFAHLSLIGAENLHFAFRMLLVLFRRELSFTEALCMWEMIWAADFDESLAQELEESCLKPLVLQLPRKSDAETGEDTVENGSSGNTKGGPRSKNGQVERSISDNSEMKSASSYPFCGLTRSFWSRNDDHMEICNVVSSTRNGDGELPVFCVAAILILNRQKVIKETHSIDDLIKAGAFS